MRKYNVRWWHSEEWMQERWEQVRCSLRADADKIRTERCAPLGIWLDEHTFMTLNQTLERPTMAEMFVYMIEQGLRCI